MLNAVDEDSGPPSGAVGTLISGLVDFATAAGQLDNVTDADLGALLGIAITAADTTSGVWWYSLDDGASFSVLGPVADNNARLLAADALTRIYFQPLADYSGTLADALKFRAWDQTTGANGGLADASVNGAATAFSTATDAASLTVTPVNDAPLALNNSYSTFLSLPIGVGAPGVLSNDSDPDGDPLSAELVSGPSVGSLTLNPDGSFTYTPPLLYLGPDSFTYRAFDGVDYSNVATVNINVGAGNNAPSAADDTYNINEDVTLALPAVGVLANDSDPDGDTLAAVLDSGPANGILTLSANGSLTYTPNAHFNGLDSFTYHVTDGSLTSASATVTINVISVNDAPTSANESYSVAEDGVLNIPAAGVLANDNDVEGGPLAALLVAGPANGGLTLNADGSFSYTPNTDFNGIDSFTYRAGDGTATSNLATVSITVNPSNDAPIAQPESYVVSEDGLLNVPAAGVLLNDIDVDGNSLTAVVAAGPANGSLLLNADGSFTYAPNTDFNGVDSFSYRANDGTTNSNLATVTITVNAVNDLPVAQPDGYSMAEDGALNVPAAGVLANDNDLDADPLTALLVAGPVNGGLTLNADGSFSYTPNADFSGIDSFTYRASDGTAVFNLATVSITVNPANNAPIAQPESYVVSEDGLLSVPAAGVLLNDSDVDGNSLTAVLAAGPANGSLLFNADGSFTYTPNADFNGVDSFSYRANDGTTNSNLATVTITINAVNDLPAAQPDSYGMAEDGALNIPAAGVLANDADIDGNPLTALLVGGPANGSLTLNADGSFTYTPNADFNGIDNFTYRAQDGAAGSNPATVAITVSAVNDAPFAVTDNYSVSEDGVLNVGARRRAGQRQ